MQTTQTPGKARLWTKYFFIIAGMNLIFGICLQFFNSTSALYVQTLGGTATFSGMMLTTFTVAATVMRIISGRFLDKKGRSLIIILGSLIFAAGALAFNIGWLPALPVARFIQGIGYSMATTGASVAITDVVAKKRMGEGIGYFALTTSVAPALGPAIAMALYGDGNHALVYYTATACCLVCAATMTLGNYERDNAFLEKKRAQDALVPDQKPAAASAAASTAKRSLIWTYFEKTSFKPALINLFISFPNGAVVAFLMLYAKTLSIPEASLYYTINAIALITARLVCSRFADRFGPLVTTAPALVLGFFGYGCLLFSSQVTALFFVAGAVIGLANGMAQPTLNAAVMKRAPAERRGAASATYLVSMDVGIGAGSFIWGLIIDMSGYNAVFTGCVACMAVGLVLSFLWLREKKTA